MVTETISAKLELAADQFSSTIGDATKSLGTLEGKSNSANKAIAGLGVAMAGLSVAALGKSVQAAADFEEAMAGVEKVTDPETAERMSGAIKDLAAEAPLAHEELAQIAETAGKLGVPSDEIEGFTENVAKMAASTDLAAEEAADAFARVSTLMEIPMEKSEELGSAINELANNFGTSASEITDVMTRAGGAFNALGLAEDEALGLSAAMNEVSPSSRLAAGGLKRMSEALMDPGTVEDIAGALGMTTEEFQGIIDENPQEAIMMVSEAMNEGGEASTQLREDLGKVAGEFGTLGQNTDAAKEATEDAAGQFENATSLTEEFETVAGTFNSQMQIMRNRLHNLAIDIGTVVLPYVAAFMSKVSDALEVLIDLNAAFNGMPAVIALVGSLIGGLAMAAGSMAAVLGGSGAAAAAASGAIAGLAAVVSALLSPIGLAIGLIAGLAYAFHTNFGGIRDQTMRVVDAIREHLLPAFGGFGDAEGILETIKNAVASFVETAEPYVSYFAEVIADKLIAGIKLLGNVLSVVIPVAMRLFQSFVQIASAAFTRLMDDVIGPFLAWFAPIWEKHLSAIAEELKLTVEGWVRTFRTFVEFVEPYISAFLERVTAWWAEHGDEVIAIVEPLLKILKRLFVDHLSIIVDIVKFFLRILRLDFAGANDALLSIVDTLVTGIVDLFRWLHDILIGNSIIPDMLNAIVDFFTNFSLYEAAKTTATDILDAYVWLANKLVGPDSYIGGLLRDIAAKIENFSLFDAGKSLVEGFAKGVRSAKDKVINAVEEVAQAARDRWPRSDAKEGPLSDVSSIGPTFISMIADGIEANKGRLSASTVAAAGAASEAAKDALGVSKAAFKAAMGEDQQNLRALRRGKLDPHGQLRPGDPSSTITNAEFLAQGFKNTSVEDILAEAPRANAAPGASADSSESAGVNVDFGNLDDDDLVSVGTIKKKVLSEVEERDTKRARTLDRRNPGA